MKHVVPLALVLVACGGSPTPKASRHVSTAGVHRLQIGALDAYVLADGHLELPNDGAVLAVGQPPAAVGDVLAAATLPRDPIRLDIQCLLVTAGDRVMLFDTGLGDFGDAKTGHLRVSLARAKIDPAAVTDIFITHAHGDHIGGLLTNGALAFPAATIRLSAPEWAFLQASTDDDSKRMVAAIASKVVAFEPDAQVLPIVKAIGARGHTVGHSSYVVGAGAETLLVLGDVAHHSVLSVQHPAWSVAVDADHEVANATRQQTLARLAGDHTRVFAGHFPYPGLGHVATSGQGLAWTPE